MFKTLKNFVRATALATLIAVATSVTSLASAAGPAVNNKQPVLGLGSQHTNGNMTQVLRDAYRDETQRNKRMASKKSSERKLAQRTKPVPALVHGLTDENGCYIGVLQSVSYVPGPRCPSRLFSEPVVFRNKLTT